MKAKLIFFLSALLTISAVAAPIPANKANWEQIDNDHGIMVWKKEIPGEPIVAFRGQAVIDASIAKVANVLIDTSRKKEWVAKVVEAKDIRQISELERVEYNHTASGFFMVKDRDFVFDAKVELDKPTQTMTIHLHSVEDPAMPPTNKVRGELKDSTYVLKSIEGGKKTFLSVEIQADPKGNVPKWLVNLFQKAWPSKTIEGIRKQCAKIDVKEDPRIAAYFKS